MFSILFRLFLNLIVLVCLKAKKLSYNQMFLEKGYFVCFAPEDHFGILHQLPQNKSALSVFIWLAWTHQFVGSNVAWKGNWIVNTLSKVLKDSSKLLLLCFIYVYTYISFKGSFVSYLAAVTIFISLKYFFFGRIIPRSSVIWYLLHCSGFSHYPGRCL